MKGIITMCTPMNKEKDETHRLVFGVRRKGRKGASGAK